jgi:hypothetical protein
MSCDQSGFRDHGSKEVKSAMINGGPFLYDQGWNPSDEKQQHAHLTTTKRV